MSKNLSYDFSVDRENHSIKIKREFAAERQLVWNAYTKPELLDLWWAPKPWKCKTKSMDFREGGHWHYSMVGPEGEEHFSWAQYLKIAILETFTGLDGFSDQDGNIKKEMPQSKWSVAFADKGELTLVDYLITFDDLSQLEATIQMGFKEGITLAMEGLDEVLKNLIVKK